MKLFAKIIITLSLVYWIILLTKVAYYVLIKKVPYNKVCLLYGEQGLFWTMK